jgi:coatomer subunit beta'
VTALKVTKEAGMLHSLTRTRSATTSCVYSAKFITRKKLFATGDGYGYICIYAYTMDKVKKFEAYHGKPVSLLAVHSTYPFLLSSSSCDRSIKLWAWDQQWACTRTFDAHTSGVQHVRFNPADVNTFVSVSCGGACVKVNFFSSLLFLNH